MNDWRNKIELVHGDITCLRVDAIVNAANSSLQGGGGVDGAIHRAAGPDLLRECQTLGECPTGQARITRGYRMAVRWVIHTVGPVWHGGSHDEEQLLAMCYRSCFALVPKHGIRSMAFPSISTGVYGFPVEKAAPIAVREAAVFLREYSGLDQLHFVCFDLNTYAVYEQTLDRDLDPVIS
jgi:O-acetyl-ADP-ribose deacetylase (regulator of RNase III)